MRREGFELTVGRPQVVTKTIDGVVLIPLIMLALPKSWFTMPTRTEDDSTEYDQNESSEPDHDTAQPVD